jgi:hypothetical protein
LGLENAVEVCPTLCIGAAGVKRSLDWRKAQFRDFSEFCKPIRAKVVIARSEATKQSSPFLKPWIASLRSQ